MAFNVPLSQQKARLLSEQLQLDNGGKVVDFGCGRGEFLIRISEHFPVTSVGIDCDRACIDAAQSEAQRRAVNDRCEFSCCPVEEAAIGVDSLDVAICLGSTHAFASGEAAFANTLVALKDWLRPGGLALVGEGYWKCDPDPDYLEIIGEPVGIYRDHRGNVALAEQQGFVPLLAMVSSPDEWDEFEWGHQRDIEKRAAARPGDPDLGEKLARRRRWLDAYLRWGRDTMGFGYYLLQKPTN